jgi:hypothetical protein
VTNYKLIINTKFRTAGIMRENMQKACKNIIFRELFAFSHEKIKNILETFETD